MKNFWLLNLTLGLGLVVASPLSAARRDLSGEILNNLLKGVQARTDIQIDEMRLEVGRGHSIPGIAREGELDRGVVRLSGVASSQRDKDALEDIARNTSWVREVENCVTVEQGRKPKAARVVEHVRAACTTGDYWITANVKKDAVILSGAVANEEDKAVIESAARSVKGIREIDSKITVARPYSNKAIEAAALEALKNEKDISTKDLSIEVADGVASVSGDRANHRQIDRILSVVLMVPGVKDIDSKMTVNKKAYAQSYARQKSFRE